ncbi:MAG TPA: extracellular solute-binding protein [Gaiellales bacterium]|jgi:multiple sugar transport system substrate-binding protein|nr:extracellular solute-binding protein [Gaiellales bacterium]
MTERGETGRRRVYTRRQVVRGALGAGAAAALGPLAAACGGSSGGGSNGGGGSITIGSFSDPAMVPFRDDFLPKFKQETGITVHWRETNYDAWYQNSKTDGLQKTGAYDVYVMDDNWVPEFAAGGIVQSLDKLGLKVNSDILPKGLDQGYWPPKSGPRLKAFADATPELFSLVIIDDVQMLYYDKDYFSSPPVTWDDILNVAKAKSNPPTLYGWSPRGVAGNPIVQTYLPLLNSYGGNFANDDWSPGFAGSEGVGALERLFEFIPYMPSGVADFDTTEETALMLQGHCMAMTEYTGTAHIVDDPKQSKVVGKIDFAATPKQVISGPAIGTFICGIASGAPNTEGAVKFLEWFTSSKVQKEFAGGGSAAVTGSALRDEALAAKFRWLPAIADAVDNSIPKPRTPDEPKMEDLLGTALNQALVEAISKKSGYTQIAQSHLTTAANQITAYLKQQGTY